MLLMIRLGKAPPSEPRRPKTHRWGATESALALKIRLENPTCGKFKIYHISRRDHNFTLSESTVGLILEHLMKTGKICKSISANRTKRRRKLNSHAKPLPFKKYENMILGECARIDHVFVSKSGCSLKRFQAWERKFKTIVAQLYSRARGKDAKKFRGI